MNISEGMINFLFGAGSAGTIVGALMIWRVQKMWNNIDEIPQLIRSIKEVKASVDGFSGELKTIERMMYANQKDIAVTDQRVTAAFGHIDRLNREMKI